MIPMPRLTPSEEQDVDRLMETGEGEGELSRLLLDLRAAAPTAPARTPAKGPRPAIAPAPNAG